MIEHIIASFLGTLLGIWLGQKVSDWVLRRRKK